jgi:photosystem II stability/assembly factor-like uncharacterized protein
VDDGRFVRSVAVDGIGRNYFGGHIGVSRTADGLTWTFIPTGEGYTANMILDPNGKAFYLTAHTLYKIPDLYAPFGPTNDGVDIGVGLPGSVVNGIVSQDKTQPATFFAGLTNHGLYKTSDAGSTWSRLDLPNVEVGATPFASISPSNGQVVYGSPGNKYRTLAGGGLYKSINGGGNWTDSSAGLPTPEARDVNSIALHQDAPSAVVIATDDGLYRSTDGGANWTLVLQILDGQAVPLRMSSVRFHPFDSAILYAAANHVNPDNSVRTSSGVWKSVNGGSTWAQVLSGKRAVQVRIEGTGRVVVMLSRDLSQPALLASSDGGTTWGPFNNGITDNDGVTLAQSIREQGSKVVFTSMTTGLYVLDQRPPRLFGISTRAPVQTGDNVMIGGFIIGGALPKTVVVRGRGPSLGVAGALADPTLTLVPSSGPIVTNDDWQSAANAPALEASGFAPGNPKESAIMATLSPGAYTAIVSGVGKTTGVAIVEVYKQ